jgi:pSer/pThr/pTyr-binding forkhead associated (FHA) protein
LFFTVNYLFNKKLYDSYNEKIKNEKERIENQEKINLEQENKIKDQDAKFNELKIQEENRINQEKELEQEQKRVKDEESLIKAMLSRGKFPLLRYSFEDTTQTFEINVPKVLIGRDKSCFISIDNNHLSRKHFSIEFFNNTYTLTDNNSANGLLLNGVKIDKVELKHGDIIEIANMKFIFYT